jgi:hypothetical protein
MGMFAWTHHGRRRLKDCRSSCPPLSKPAGWEYKSQGRPSSLGRELHEVIHEGKKMATQIQQSSDLRDLEHCLTERRKEIDRKYNYDLQMC